MFKQYKILIDNAIHNEEISNKQFEDKRNNLSLEIKQTIQNEMENLNNKQLLKDYSPIKHTNKMTELNTKYSNLHLEEHKKINDIKNELDENLLTIMEIERKPNNFPNEIYKIISCCSHKTNYICRVYFTLISIKHWNCIPGDPIKIEWIDMNCCRNNDKTDGIIESCKRTGSGFIGLKMPQFNNPGQTICNENKLYDFNHWGDNSNQQKWWKEWIQNNRPI